MKTKEVLVYPTTAIEYFSKGAKVLLKGEGADIDLELRIESGDSVSIKGQDIVIKLVGRKGEIKIPTHKTWPYLVQHL